MPILDILLQPFLKKVLGRNLEALSLKGVMAVLVQDKKSIPKENP